MKISDVGPDKAKTLRSGREPDLQVVTLDLNIVSPSNEKRYQHSTRKAAGRNVAHSWKGKVYHGLVNFGFVV